jgi:hypothetical protein
VLTAAIQPPRFHCSIDDRYTTHLGTGQRYCQRALPRRIGHCATIARSTGRSAKQRRRTSDTSSGEQRPTAGEVANPLHHRLHLLRHVCRKTSAVHSSSIKTTSIQKRPRSVAPSHQRTAKLVTQHFVWPGIQKDCRTWTRDCQACQRSKVSRHTVTSLTDFTPPPALFLHVHIGLVRPLPTSAGYTYCLAAVDRFAR